jgi:small subunit ribosomal protein S6
MKKNHYESVVIINAALEDEQINSLVSKIEDHLKSKEAEITDVDKKGRKRLAYPIQKSKSGYYVIFRFIAETSVISGLERIYRLDENVIRYLTIVLDARALEHIQEQKEKDSDSEPEKETDTADTSKDDSNEKKDSEE